MEVVSIPVIVAIVYAVVEVYKVIFKNNEIGTKTIIIKLIKKRFIKNKFYG